MVDFQSRDTRRDADDGDDDEPTDESGDGATDESGADEPDSASDREERIDDGSGSGGDHVSGQDHEHGHDHGHRLDVDLLGVAVVTVSSTRSLDDDPSGDVIQAVVEGDDHEVATRKLLRDDFDSVQSTVKTLVGRDDVDVVIITGGTGVTPDDVTIEAVRGLFDKTLPGFGELFRLLSYDEIGTMVVATRATAGIVDGVPVFCLPGSENAAHLGTEEIILPEMEHLAGLATREE
jgi:molybdenum cofactor biosynthesis protein B